MKEQNQKVTIECGDVEEARTDLIPLAAHIPLSSSLPIRCTFQPLIIVLQPHPVINTMLDSIVRLFSTRPKIACFSVLFLLSVFYLSRPFAFSYQPHFPSFPKDDFIYPGHVHHAALNQTRPRRVAIVGAGASGSSAAWFLRRAGRVMEQRIGVGEGELLREIMVFDQEGYVGGRESRSPSRGWHRWESRRIG